MIFENDFLAKLKDFGLNSYESKLWVSLLSRGNSTAGELSDISNVPRSRTYDVLESLERKGFITMKLGKPIKYAAVPPAEVVEKVKKRINNETTSQIESLNTLKSGEVIKELNTLHDKGFENIDPSELSGSLRGRLNVYNHFSMKVKNSKKSISIITTETGLVRKAEEIKRIAGNKKINAKIRIIAPITSSNKKAVAEISKFADIRSSDKLVSRFALFDGNELMLMLTDDEKTHPSYDAGVWINSTFLVESLENMFNETWKNLK